MAFDRLTERIPAPAKDLKLNLSSLSRQTELNEEQFWGTVYTSALTLGNDTLTELIKPEVAEYLSAETSAAAETAAALMGMNNIYYRFGHLSSNAKYLQLPSKLRMNALRSHGADQNTFELWCLAASALSGCGLCIDSHEKKLREEGVGEEAILTAVRIASVLNGVSKVLSLSADS